MIILDTNVVSELMKIEPAPQVLKWPEARAEAELYLTTMTVAEILLGIELVPKGKRRTALESAAEETFRADFEGRILAFDSDAAREFAKIVAGRRKAGKPISQTDAQIAAIARSCG